MRPFAGIVTSPQASVADTQTLSQIGHGNGRELRLKLHAAISSFCSTNALSTSVTTSIPTGRPPSTTGIELMR
jgi:hypothetical protein